LDLAITELKKKNAPKAEKADKETAKEVAKEIIDVEEDGEKHKKNKKKKVTKEKKEKKVTKEKKEKKVTNEKKDKKEKKEKAKKERKSSEAEKERSDVESEKEGVRKPRQALRRPNRAYATHSRRSPPREMSDRETLLFRELIAKLPKEDLKQAVDGDRNETLSGMQYKLLKVIQNLPKDERKREANEMMKSILGTSTDPAIT